MSIIQKIQEKGAWIVFILISIALIAFIMMDYSKGGNMFGNNTVIGKVNGDKIAYSSFNSRVDMVQQMQGNQSVPREQVMAGVWNYFVQTTLLSQAYKKLGLECTQKDIDNALYGSNPPQFLQQFVNQQTGQYDAAAAANALAQVKTKGTQQQKDQVSQFIEQEQQQIMVGKYQSLLMGATYVPTWLAQKTVADNSLVAKASYITVPYASISDSAVAVSDADINDYVSKHQKLFEQKEEGRSINLISFNASASSADSASILEGLDNMKTNFTTATDNESFIQSKDGSIPYYGGYMSEKSMQANKLPVTDEALATAAGTVYGPFVNNGSYLLAKMIGKTSIADSVKVRHILVATVQQDQSGQLAPVRDDSAALKRIDSAVAAIKSGATFDSIAIKYSDDTRSAVQGGVIDYFPSGAIPFPEFNDFAFTGKTGDAKVIKTQYGYDYVQILGQKGSTEGYKVAFVGRPIDPSQHTIDSVNNVASEFVASNQTAKAFEESAKKKNIAIQPIQELKANDFQIGNVGSSRDLVKWAYAHKVGDVSQPLEIGSNIVVADLATIAKAGLPEAASVRPYIQTLLANQKKAKIIIDTKFKGNTLESYAQSSGGQIATLDSITFSSTFLPNVGNEPKLVGAAFNKTLLNKVSQPIAGSNFVFAILPTSVTANPSMDGGAAAVKSSMKQSWMQQIQSRFISALQQDAKVEDDRSKFF